MPARYGLKWKRTGEGELTEAELPDDGYDDHYILDGPTKFKSSYPVVDADGKLRRRNVELAWNLRGHAERKEYVVKVAKYLGRLFDENPLPDDAYDQNMTELTINTIRFAEYNYSKNDWVKWQWSGSPVYGEVRNRTKNSMTVDGNEISGDEGEPVYKMQEYDTDSGEFTDQMVAKPQSSLNSWDGPKENSNIERAALTQSFEMDKERIFKAWNSLVNMSEEQMEMWEDHPCSDVGVDMGSDNRDNTMMLMGQAPDGWNQESYMVANQVVAWARQHIDQMPEDAANAGKGTCPAPVAVKMLNRGINPFDSFPGGNPTFEEGEGTEADTIEFEVDDEELDEVYSQWSDEVNMTASQLDSWSDHPCADEASNDPQTVRERNMMLLETNKSDWTQKHIDAANRTISFLSRMRGEGQKPDSPSEGGKGSCPSEWAISLLNWAYNPFDGMPDGTPDPEQNNADPLDADDELTFSVSGAMPERTELVTEFNEYGIRENEDDDGNLVSVDAVFEAMEPGPPEDRNGVRIRSEFLEEVAGKDYSNRPPYLMDHQKDTLSHIGYIQDVWFNEAKDKLMLMARAYNTGSQTSDEVIKRMTFDPPMIQDGSVGFGENFQMEKNDDGEATLTDGRIKEFSTTPFPAGYDDGGLRTTSR